MHTRKHTAWKKSRKFGDVKGGRNFPKITDNIFNRAHSLQRPSPHDETPIFMVDNPSKDFFFPITVEDIKQVLATLPPSHSESLTHIWLRKVSSKDYEKYSTQGMFICGSGVNLIVLFPFPRSLKMQFGKKKPPKKLLKWYAYYTPELIEENGKWHLQWTAEKIKQYYLEGLLLHEIGHQIDSYYKRYWSKTYKNRAEQFADNFAYYWADKVRSEVPNHLSNHVPNQENE